MNREQEVNHELPDELFQRFRAKLGKAGSTMTEQEIEALYQKMTLLANLVWQSWAAD